MHCKQIVRNRSWQTLGYRYAVFDSNLNTISISRREVPLRKLDDTGYLELIEKMEQLSIAIHCRLMVFIL